MSLRPVSRAAAVAVVTLTAFVVATRPVVSGGAVAPDGTVHCARVVPVAQVRSEALAVRVAVAKLPVSTPVPGVVPLMNRWPVVLTKVPATDGVTLTLTVQELLPGMVA